MEAYFDSVFDDVSHELSIILLLSKADILGKSRFSDHELENIKNIALEKIHRQRNLKEIIALEFLEKHFSD